MIGNIIGALAGNQAAKHIQDLNETGGALLGALLRRLGPLGLLAAAGGGYAYKKCTDRREAQKRATAKPSVLTEPTRTQA